MELDIDFVAALKKVGELGTPEKICALSNDQIIEYKNKLDYFKLVNGGEYSNEVKGTALEDLVSYLLMISGNIFTVVRNVKTHTNEIDQIVELNAKGKVLYSYGLLPKRFNHFLGECKNHRRKIDVSYIGKFYSLLLSTAENTGILFSYYGITGRNWSDGNGLIRKIYLQKEDDEKRTAIIDFALNDFQRIADGENFIDIIDNKLKSLKYDTSVDQFISAHPAEGQLLPQ